MKITEFNARKNKNYEHIRIPYENHENHENLKFHLISRNIMQNIEFQRDTRKL